MKWNQNSSIMYLSENILHFCCILCCMEDWWWTSTSLIEYWSNTWLSCYVCLQNGATLCDACGCSDGLLGLFVNTEVRTMELGDCLLASHFKVLLKGQGIDITSLLSPASWKCPLMSFVCPFFVPSQYVNTMAIGDKLDEKGPQARNALLIRSGHKHLWWGSWNYSRIVFFSYSNVYISVQIKNTFLQGNRDPMQKSKMHCLILSLE